MEKSFKAIRRITRELMGPAVLAALIVWILHRSLFSGGHLVPALPRTDLFMEFMPWRYFGFSQWKAGHFPFWNPHVFSGTPFISQSQTCLLYPIAWVHFLFNTATAITVEASLDLYAGALCAYVWARQRQISRSGATLAGAVFIFSGPVYLHLMEGGVSILASSAWMPLVFLGIDRLLGGQTISGVLIGSIAVALQCFGGHGQIVYYTGLVAALYIILQSLGQGGAWRCWAAFIAMYALGGALAGVQLIPSCVATAFSTRAGGVSYSYATMLLLPPENLLTLFIPYPLGDIANLPYMGRWYVWETTVYAGMLTLLLACVGISSLEKGKKWRMMVLLGIVLMLALGAYTPLHGLLYRFLPGFNLFRGASKFATMWVMFLAILAGTGWDRIVSGAIRRQALLIIVLAAMGCLALGAIILSGNPRHGPMAELLKIVLDSREFYVKPAQFMDTGLEVALAHSMGIQWLIAGGLLLCAGTALFGRRFFSWSIYAILVLAIAEPYLAVVDNNPISPLKGLFPQQWTQAAATAIHYDQRLLFTAILFCNSGDELGYDSVWGYEAQEPARYAQLIAASQDEVLLPGDQYEFNLRRVSRIFQLLRCRYILQWNGKVPILEVRDPMPHLQLIGNYVRMGDSSAIADRLVKDFDFRQSAILESEPVPAPVAAGTAGRVELVRESINDMEIAADLPAPALLLVTDAYAPGWRVRTIEQDPPQSVYDVLPADDVLRAIPLAAGHHHFDLYYTPPGWWAGIDFSIAGFAVWIALLIRIRWRGSCTRFKLRS